MTPKSELPRVVLPPGGLDVQEIELYRSDYVEVNGATITVSADSAEPVKLTIVGPYSVMSP